MSILGKFRQSRRAARLLQEAEALLLDAQQHNAAPPDRAAVAPLASKALLILNKAEAIGYDSNSSDRAHFELRLSEALFLLSRPDEALAPARRAAQARPYDVDSRITHGIIRLALDHLPESLHEYNAVLEEFGGDPDGTAGRRAVILARGYLPLEENITDADLAAASDLLLTAWEAAGAVYERFHALRKGGAEVPLLDHISTAAHLRGITDLSPPPPSAELR